MCGLASRFAAQGYATYSAHNFRKKSWNRDIIHPKLGFERSEFMEDMDLSTLPSDDWRPADRVLYETAQKAYEDLPTDQPAFLYLLTVYTHGYYDDDSGDYGEADFRERTRVATDDMLDFIAHVEAIAQKRDRPLAIVVFSDHKPSLNRVFLESRVLPEELFVSTENTKTPRFVLQPSYEVWRERAKVSAYLRLPDKDETKTIAQALDNKPMFCLPAELSALISGDDDNFWASVNAVCQTPDHELLDQTSNPWGDFFPEGLYAQRLF